MKQPLHTHLRMQGFLAAPLAVVALAAHPPMSQAQDRTARIEGRMDQQRQPLTAAEIDQATAALESDDRARGRLAGSQRVRTVLVERREEEKAAPASQRRADVVKY